MAVLIAVREYIKENKKVAFADLCNHFDVAPDVMRHMLEMLEQKELIARVDPVDCGGKCGSCGCCGAEVLEEFVWIEDL